MTYGMYFEKLGFIPVSKDFMRTMFSRIESEEDIEAYSRDLGNIVVNEYASLFYPKLNRETLIQSSVHTYNTAKHTTSLTLVISPTSVAAGGTYRVSGTLGDHSAAVPLASKTITFTSTSPKSSVISNVVIPSSKSFV